MNSKFTLLHQLCLLLIVVSIADFHNVAQNTGHSCCLPFSLGPFNQFISSTMTNCDRLLGITPQHYVDIPVEKATFGMGCFWLSDSLFGAQLGVIRTRVGYSGGTSKNPNYKNIGDHIEVIEIDYDPKQITYNELLSLFWNNHEFDPTTRVKHQYMSLILYHNEEQRLAAEDSLQRIQIEKNAKLLTTISPAGIFYPAEEYHQKYKLQAHRNLCNEIGIQGSDMLQSSHLAARLNGYLVGYGGIAQFEKELPYLGLSKKQADHVRREIKRHKGAPPSC